MPASDIEVFITRCISHVLAADNLTIAIQRARALGELIWRNNIPQYQLKDLEDALLARCKSGFKAPQKPEHLHQYLHVLTRAYASGGHTRVVEHLLASKALPDACVLVTEKAPQNTLVKLSTQDKACVLLPEFKNKHDKIQHLLALFCQYQTLILHVHPYDIESVLAAGLARHFFGTKIYFYNHADHVFSYGHGMADIVLELSYFGWELSKIRGTHHKCVFAGIPLKLPDTIIDRPDNANGHIASAGTAYKYKPGGGYSFPDFARSLLAKTDRSLMLIGPNLLTNWWWWLPALKMGRRAVFHKRMAYQDYLACMKQASVYVDSFPLTGGTAFPEMAIKGLPSFGILSGAHGYSPADQLKSSSTTALLADLETYLQQQIRPGINHAAIMQQIRDVHAVENVAIRISRAESADEQEKQVPWPNPAPINCDFYEKIWAKGKLFMPPIHNAPDWKLSVLFLRYWLQSRKLSN